MKFLRWDVGSASVAVIDPNFTHARRQRAFNRGVDFADHQINHFFFPFPGPRGVVNVRVPLIDSRHAFKIADDVDAHAAYWLIRLAEKRKWKNPAKGDSFGTRLRRLHAWTRGTRKSPKNFS